MKKITLLLSIFISTSALFSQTIPNASFETWTNDSSISLGYEVPQGWMSSDVVESIFNDGYTGPTVSKTNQSQSGAFAVKMENIVYNNDTINSMIFSIASIEEFFGGVFGGFAIGFPYNSKPSSLQGYYKLNAVGNDQAGVSVLMTKWNTITNQRDTIVNSYYGMASNVSVYTMFNMPLTYIINENPDTVLISTGFFDQQPDGTALNNHPGSTFYIDALAFSGTATGINETLSALSPIKFYPNPFSTSAKIAIDPSIELNNASISIVDLVGKKVWEQSNIKNYQLTIERGDLPDGLYFYKVLNNNAEIATGKVIIK